MPTSTHFCEMSLHTYGLVFCLKNELISVAVQISAVNHDWERLASSWVNHHYILFGLVKIAKYGADCYEVDYTTFLDVR